MQKSDLIAIGQLGKTHGVEGEISARITIEGADFLSIYRQHTPLFIFIDLDGLPVPFCIEDLRTKGDDLFLLRLRHIITKEEAQKLVNAPIFIESKYLPEEVSFTPQHFVGFEVRDQHERPIGTITRVDDTTMNILFYVEKEDASSILLPVADELLCYVDAEKKIIALTIPEGLLEV